MVENVIGDAVWKRRESEKRRREQMQFVVGAVVAATAGAVFLVLGAAGERLGTVNFEAAASRLHLFLSFSLVGIREWPFQTQNIAYQKTKSPACVCF